MGSIAADVVADAIELATAAIVAALEDIASKIGSGPGHAVTAGATLGTPQEKP